MRSGHRTLCIGKGFPVSIAEVINVINQMDLAAIALQTGRAKDHARLLQFIEAAAIDAERFQSILRRHGLVDRWRAFEPRFLQDES